MICVSHQRTGRIESAEITGHRDLVDTLVMLMRRFHLPHGGAMVVSSDGREVVCDRNDSMIMVAQQLTS